MPVLPRLNSRILRCLVAGSALGAIVIGLSLSAVAPARAEDDAPDTKFLRSVLRGLGLRDGNEEGITYRERSPLVIPPDRTLPPPEKSAVVSDPNWPVEPEVRRAKELKADKSAPGATGDPWYDAGRPIPRDQLDRGRRSSGKSRSASNDNGTNEYESGKPMSPTQLGYKGGLLGNMFGSNKDEVAKFTGEPERTSLTEPPVGYQTPSPNQPYGLGKDKTPEKAKDYFTTHGTEY
jgi:hypothetical protein